MESGFIAKPSKHGYVFSSMQLANVPVHKIQSYFTNCVAGYMNQFSCICANAAVLLPFVVITQTFPWIYCQSSTNFVQSFISVCHLCVAIVHTIQSVTWNLFVYKKIVLCVEMMYQVTASLFFTTFCVEIWCMYHKQTWTASMESVQCVWMLHWDHATILINSMWKKQLLYFVLHHKPHDRK
jgi:hypothetical protein